MLWIKDKMLKKKKKIGVFFFFFYFNIKYIEEK